MEQEELNDILTTLQSINHSLDKRFEKEANVYVPQEEVEALKRLIFAGEYAKIVSNESFTPEALTNVVLKNAWLIQDPAAAKVQPLREIFDSCDFGYLSSLMHNSVFENRLELAREFRNFIIGVFLDRESPATCAEMLEQTKFLFLNNPQLRAVCVRRVLEKRPILERYRRFCVYTQKWENLVTEKAILAELFKAKDIAEKF